MNLRGVFTSVLLCGALFGQSAAPASRQSSDGGTPASNPPTTNPIQSAKPAQAHTMRPERFAGRAGQYYRLIWGVDLLSVKWVESGEMIRFTYRVLDSEKAKTLADKKIEPSLVDEQAHVKLVVPTMDKVGKLRQTPPPEAGKTYWMLFSNKGGYVKRGHRVNVVIGDFHADGLVVD